MDPLTALRLQLEWGADEALAEAPQPRLATVLAAPPASVSPAHGNPIVSAAPQNPPPLQAAPNLPRASDAPTLETLHALLERFDACPLRRTATKLVFADGNPDAGLMLIGEAPGAEEDVAGLPFVGASGRLLDRMLATIGLDRRHYRITNLIPWRPPGNRTPTDQEVAQCLPFLIRHIELVRPRHLVLLGALACQVLSGEKQGIRRARGHWRSLRIGTLPEPVAALPMFHPAYLLRTPAAKREAWADMISLKLALMGNNAAEPPQTSSVAQQNPPLI